MPRIKLGIASTRRNIFNAPDAIKYRRLTKDRLKILEKFKTEKIDGLFFPHCNFGTEYVCARHERPPRQFDAEANFL